jgi:polyisoprenoid-binding protein YceI
MSLRWVMIIIGFFGFIITHNGGAFADEFVIDPGHTSIHFRVDHFQFSKVQGRFNDISGKFSFDPKSPADANVHVIVDIGSIDTNHQSRDDHLRDPTYFNVAKYPTAEFKSTRVQVTGKRTGLIFGELKILGVTVPVTLEATFNGIALHPLGKQYAQYRGITVAGFSARTSIDRQSFGMTTGQGEKGNIAELTIEVEGWSKPK